MQVCACMRTYVHTYICTYIGMHAHWQACTYACMYLCSYVHKYWCAYVICMYKSTQACMPTNRLTHAENAGFSDYFLWLRRGWKIYGRRHLKSAMRPLNSFSKLSTWSFIQTCFSSKKRMKVCPGGTQTINTAVIYSHNIWYLVIPIIM